MKIVLIFKVLQILIVKINYINVQVMEVNVFQKLIVLIIQQNVI
jgi:hypothetical protein